MLRPAGVLICLLTILVSGCATPAGDSTGSSGEPSSSSAPGATTDGGPLLPRAFADYGSRDGVGGPLESLAHGAPPLGDPARPTFMQLEVFARRAPERLIPDLNAHVEAWHPDVLVHESSEYAACLVAETLDLPHASIGTCAWSSREERRAFFADALSALRVAIGLSRDPDASMMFRYLQFGLPDRPAGRRG